MSKPIRPRIVSNRHPNGYRVERSRDGVCFEFWNEFVGGWAAFATIYPDAERAGRVLDCSEKSGGP